jgi:uroporphyrinogen-III synthase
MRKVLLTRSSEENDMLAKELEYLSFEPVFCPMLSCEKRSMDFSGFKGVKDIIATSKFAAKILSEEYHHFSNIYVVGVNSARIVSTNPMLNIGYIGKDAADIKNHFERLKLPKDELVYFSGNNISTEFGFGQRVIIYDAIYTKEISDEVVHRIAKGVEYILLYSKNCADNLISLLSKHDLLQKVGNSVVISLSENIGSNIRKYFLDVIYPDEPDSEEMIKLLRQYDSKR